MVKRRVFEYLLETDLEFGFIKVNKFKIWKKSLRENKTVLYTYLSRILLESMILKTSHESNLIEIVADRQFGKIGKDNFTEYINLKLNSHQISITHKDSRSCSGLQFVDFVCGAVFEKFAKNTEKYFQYLKPKLKVEIDFC